MRKRRLLSCAAALALLIAASGCAMLYAKMIEGTWKVDSYYKNGEDQTNTFINGFIDYRITFHPDGAFTETYKLNLILTTVPVTVTGTWELTGTPGNLLLTLTDSTEVRIYEVREVKRDSVTIYRALPDNEYEEIYLEPVEQ